MTSPEQELKFNRNSSLSLLGIDKNDVVYMGQLNDDKVESILYGKINASTSDWHTVKLDEPLEREDIYFNDESQIIVNNQSKNILKNMMNKKETEYCGNLIQVNEEFAASIESDGKLKYTKLNK